MSLKHKLRYVAIVVLSVLGFAAGIAKVVRAPQEVAFFEGAGLSTDLLLAFGIVQVVSAVLVGLARTRWPALAILNLTFAFSAILIFQTGNVGFGVFSLLPIALSAWVFATRS